MSMFLAEPFRAATVQAAHVGCGFRAIPYTRSDRIRTPIPTFSYTGEELAVGAGVS